jgi:hypothetical protein
MTNVVSVGWVERLVRRSSKSEGGSDTHHVLNDGDGFREGLNPSYASADLPDGQITDSCPAPLRKIFRFSANPNQLYKSRHPVPREGRFAVVTDVGCGMRWTRQRQARWSNSARTNGAEAYGEVVWS